MFRKRKAINEVFTPRNPEVNTDMYIERPDLEKALSRALDGSLHPFIYGDSGCGKSWLYKRVLAEKGITEVVANCANASRLESLTQEIANAAVPDGHLSLREIEDAKKADANAGFASGGLANTRKYDAKSAESLSAAYAQLAKRKRGDYAVLVIDNLESILDSAKLLSELADIITISDDPRYARHGVKLVLVGVPRRVVEYFAKTKTLSTVGNRIKEIPRVENLNGPQVSAFVQRGFVQQLKVKLLPETLLKFQRHIYRVTLGIPQRLHEYCEELAYRLEDNDWSAANDILDHADLAWLKGGLIQSYQTIESQMNERDTRAGRRNQTLFALGRIETMTFSVATAEEKLRNEFPGSTRGVTLGISAILTDLAQRQNPIIKRTTKGNEFEFTDPRYLMALRMMLRKSPGAEKVVRIDVAST